MKKEEFINSAFNYEHCEECREEKFAEEIAVKKQEILNEGIPKRFQNAKLADFDNITPIIEWIKKPEGFLFISGQCGTGKTHLAAAITYQFRLNNIPCIFIRASDLFVELKSTFREKTNNNEASIINQYTSSAITVFDDIGAQKISEYVIESWYNIIDSRYGANYPTLFTSNMQLAEISTFMTDRLASRIASGKIFELTGTDRRLL